MNHLPSQKGSCSLNRLTYGALVLMTTGLMGSSFAVGKIGLRFVSPFLLVGLRFSIAGLLMVLLVMRRPQPRKPGDWLRIAAIGLFQTTGVMGAIFWSLRTISAGESSILTFVNPLLVVLFGSLFAGARYRLIQWAGVLLGFAGVVITLGVQLQMRAGTWLSLWAAVSWAIATLLVKRWGKRFDLWVLTAYQMLFGGSFLLLASWSGEATFFRWNPTAIGVVLYLAVMASMVQFGIWFFLLQRGDPGKTSAFLLAAQSSPPGHVTCAPVGISAESSRHRLMDDPCHDAAMGMVLAGEARCLPSAV